jgi:carbonic anhydrase/acetyltransferase-like protein (isoleucine patch superfamily)
MELVDLGEMSPDLHPDSWAAPGAWLIGDVRLAAGASVWYAAVLRGDGASISIGAASNIQDGCVLHADPGLPLTVGARVSVGHGAVLHGCTIGDDVLIGMGARVLNGAHVGDGSIVAAGAVVLEGAAIPPHSLVAGVPGKVRRETTADERAATVANAESYLALTRRHDRRARG